MPALKILVVDDDAATRKLLEKKLIMAEYEVETAADGVKAVELISGAGYDVVLTDLMMPGDVDGIGVLEAVKEKQARTEVILITASDSIEKAVEAMKKGAADYLRKPLNFDELFIRLEKIIRIKKLAQAAGDLREAMDVTEKHAGQTIQELEMQVSRLQNKISEISRILSQNGLEIGTRVNLAIEALGTKF